jgi:hypothetical protein
LESEFPVVSIANNPIERIHEIKFLGVVLDPECSWKKHIRHLASATQIRVLGLKRIMSQRIHPTIGILLYKVLIRPILLYAAPILLTASETQWDAIRRLENNGLRAAQKIYTLDISINDLYSATGIQSSNNPMNLLVNLIFLNFFRNVRFQYFLNFLDSIFVLTFTINLV